VSGVMQGRDRPGVCGPPPRSERGSPEAWPSLLAPPPPPPSPSPSLLVLHCWESNGKHSRSRKRRHKHHPTSETSIHHHQHSLSLSLSPTYPTRHVDCDWPLVARVLGGGALSEAEAWRRDFIWAISCRSSWFSRSRLSSDATPPLWLG